VGVIPPPALRITCQCANPWRKPTWPCPYLRNRPSTPRTGQASPCAERARPSPHLACSPAEASRAAACLLPDRRSVRAVPAKRAGRLARAPRQTRPSTVPGRTPSTPAISAADTPGIGLPRSKRFSGLATLTASTPSQEGR